LPELKLTLKAGIDEVGGLLASFERNLLSIQDERAVKIHGLEESRADFWKKTRLLSNRKANAAAWLET
jgi:hypothetical protein